MTTNVESSEIFNDDIDYELEDFPVLTDPDLFSSLSQQQQTAVSYVSRARRIILTTNFPLNSLKETDKMIIRMIIAHFSFLKGLENDGVKTVPLSYEGKSLAEYENLLKEHTRLFYQMMAVRAERKNEDSVQACRRDFAVSDKLYAFACSTTHFFMYTNPRPYGTDLSALTERMGVDGAGYIKEGHKTYDNVLIRPEDFNALDKTLQTRVAHLSAQRKYLRLMSVENNLDEFIKEYVLTMVIRSAGVNILDYNEYTDDEEGEFIKEVAEKKVTLSKLIAEAKINSDTIVLKKIQELSSELRSYGLDV